MTTRKRLRSEGERFGYAHVWLCAQTAGPPLGMSRGSFGMTPGKRYVVKARGLVTRTVWLCAQTADPSQARDDTGLGMTRGRDDTGEEVRSGDERFGYAHGLVVRKPAGPPQARDDIGEAGLGGHGARDDTREAGSG